MGSRARAHAWLVLGQPIASQSRILPARFRGACCADCAISPAASLCPAWPMLARMNEAPEHGAL
eukprot:2238284-Pyramimonas_sp.AAC.1